MNQVALTSPLEDYVTGIDKRKSIFSESLPSHITFEKFKRVAVAAARKDPDILKTEPESVFQAIALCASAGLMPDGQEAALVVFGSKTQFMPMIQGQIKQLMNTGLYTSINVQLVYENDEFEYDLAGSERPHHKRKWGQERGKLLLGYAIANFKGEGDVFQIAITEAWEIDKIRSISKAKKGPWFDWFEEMAKKTVLRRLIKYLSKSSEIERSLEAENVFYDLEKMRNEGSSLELPKTLNWTKEAQTEEEPEVLENKDADQDGELLDLRNAIDDAIFFDDIADIVNGLIETEIWQNSKPDFQAYILREIVAPKVQELSPKLDIGTLDVASFLALLWTLDAETLAKYLNGDFTEGHKDIKTEIKALVALRQLELANG